MPSIALQVLQQLIKTQQSRSWLKGNTDTYVLQTPFEDLLKWSQSVPHNGLLRYYVAGNMERVLVASPKALSELLVQNVYEFPKPEFMRRALARITGNHGILLVEGLEHKVGVFNLPPRWTFS